MSRVAGGVTSANPCGALGDCHRKIGDGRRRDRGNDLSGHRWDTTRPRPPKRGYLHPAEGAEQLSTILRDGPDLGVHTLIWCDTYANLERVLQRQDIAEFELRFALQMSPNDSNSFIDAPDANKLDPYLALFYDEERSGALEKFRPYDLPKMEWIQRVGEVLKKFDSQNQ